MVNSLILCDFIARSGLGDQYQSRPGQVWKCWSPRRG